MVHEKLIELESVKAKIKIRIISNVESRTFSQQLLKKKKCGDPYGCFYRLD